MSMQQQQQPPKAVQNAYLIAFRVIEGKLVCKTDVAHSEIIFQGGAPNGLKVHVEGTDIVFPQESIEKLIAFDRNDPTSARYITIRKHKIFEGYAEYAKRLKDMALGLEKRLDEINAIRTALKENIDGDPSIADLKRLYDENR